MGGSNQLVHAPHVLERAGIAYFTARMYGGGLLFPDTLAAAERDWIDLPKDSKGLFMAGGKLFLDYVIMENP